MTDDNSNLVDIENLDELENALYGEPEEGLAEEEEVIEDTGDDAAETEKDKDAPEGDDEDEDDEDLDDEDEDSEEDEEEEVPQPKGKRNRKSFQDRIDELTRRAYEAERREIEVLRRLELREAREREVAKEEPIQTHLPSGAPDPHAVDAKGEPLYPLGEFDRKYIADITKFTIDAEFSAKQREQEERYVAHQLEQAKSELKTQWDQKLEAASEDNPEIREDIQELGNAFANIHPAYGEYLAVTIMQSENGPQILDYLSQNIGEAQTIVASGPAAATLAIGRLDARLAKQAKRNTQKTVSDAPEPPERVNRGRKGQRSVRPDTDNLEDFEKIFY